MFQKPLFALALYLLNAANAGAEDAEVSRQTAKVVSYVDVLQWIFALLVVLAMFGLLVWLLRKSGNLTFSPQGQLTVLAGLSLGIRERLVLVKVGEKQVLLGITPGRIDKLLELQGEERLFQNKEETGDAGLFAKKLRQIIQSDTHA